MSTHVSTNGHPDERRLYLIDAMALAYRSHFIFISRPLINSKGQNTSASFGFTNALLKLIEQHSMAHMAVVFDKMDGEGTFRDELYEEYKAHRDPPPDELLENLPYIKDIVRALDIPVIEMAGVEADDVIGTLARSAAADGAEVVIVSPDKDFQQLLSSDISIYKPSRRGEEFDPITADSFREKYEVEPAQYIDMLALWGDSSDNVPGVPLIGEKTSAKLIKEYGSVENLIEHAEEVGGKRGQNLREYKEDAFISKKLVTIKTDLDLDLDWKRFARKEPHVDELERIFEEMEFESLLKRVRSERGLLEAGDGAAVKMEEEEAAVDFDFGPYEEISFYAEDAVDYALVRTVDALRDLVDHLEGVQQLAVDTETTSVDAMWASLVGISLSWEPGTARYIPTPMPDDTSTEEVLGIIQPLLANGTPKIGQNLKYDLMVLARHGLRIGGPLFDTMVANYLLAPEGNHDLDSISRKHLNYRMIPISELLGTGRDERSMRDVPIDEVMPYACEDADVALQLASVLRKELEKNELLKIATDIEFPLIPVLVDMELEGIRVDDEVLREISESLEEEKNRLERQIFELADMEFNINSTQQLGEVLFDRLEMPVVTKTSTGRPSTKETVLQELSTDHELPGLVLDWRKIMKLKSTYVDSLGELIHPETGRIHTTFNQTITATGRLSSSNPNLQNIPIRTELGREVRRAFVPRDGWLLMAADYVQIELRILAAMSGDEALKQDFEEGRDIHAATAARVFKKSIDDVTRDERRKAKEVNYGIPYGVSAWGLAQRLRTSVGEAQRLIDEYQRTYPRVSSYLARQVERAREQKYVETMLGRRRYVPGIDSRNRNQRSFYERVAVNMPIQGTQADMIKIAMVRLHRRIHEEGLRTRMLLQVHDELVFDVPLDEVETLSSVVKEEMVAALPLTVPVEVEIDVGENWLDAH